MVKGQPLVDSEVASLYRSVSANLNDANYGRGFEVCVERGVANGLGIPGDELIKVHSTERWRSWFFYWTGQCVSPQ